MTKECSKCKQVKPLTEFHKNCKAKDGRITYCKDCSKEQKKAYHKKEEVKRKQSCWYYRNKYGLSRTEVEDMLEKQHSKCLICSIRVSLDDSEGVMLNVDHCHDRGHVRGILCGECNRGLGHFKDNPGLLRAAADYLEKDLSYE